MFVTDRSITGSLRLINIPSTRQFIRSLQKSDHERHILRLLLYRQHHRPAGISGFRCTKVHARICWFDGMYRSRYGGNFRFWLLMPLGKQKTRPQGCRVGSCWDRWRVAGSFLRSYRSGEMENVPVYVLIAVLLWEYVIWSRIAIRLSLAVVNHSISSLPFSNPTLIVTIRVTTWHAARIGKCHRLGRSLHLQAALRIVPWPS